MARLEKAPAFITARYVDSLFGACHPCGDWAPILTWNTPSQAGGPTRAAIEQAMVRCNAFCEPAARQAFLGSLDDARGMDSRHPWLDLATACKAKVSAIPDARFATAPYFALDRIARAVAATPAGAAALAKLELPLPAVDANGNGPALPTAAVTSPNIPVDAITVVLGHVSVGKLPRGALGPNGVTVTNADAYPGVLVADSAKESLHDILGKRGPVTRFTLLAPRGMEARRVAEVVAMGGAGYQFLLAVAERNDTPGWTLPGVVPIALIAPAKQAGAKEIRVSLGVSPDAAVAAVKAHSAAEYADAVVVIALEKSAPVSSLAQLLGALAYFQVAAVSFAQ